MVFVCIHRSPPLSTRRLHLMNLFITGRLYRHLVEWSGGWGGDTDWMQNNICTWWTKICVYTEVEGVKDAGAEAMTLQTNGGCGGGFIVGIRKVNMWKQKAMTERPTKEEQHRRWNKDGWEQSCCSAWTKHLGTLPSWIDGISVFTSSQSIRWNQLLYSSDKLKKI